MADGSRYPALHRHVCNRRCCALEGLSSVKDSKHDDVLAQFALMQGRRAEDPGSLPAKRFAIAVGLSKSYVNLLRFPHPCGAQSQKPELCEEGAEICT